MSGLTAQRLMVTSNRVRLSAALSLMQTSPLALVTVTSLPSWYCGENPMEMKPSVTSVDLAPTTARPHASSLVNRATVPRILGQQTVVGVAGVVMTAALSQFRGTDDQ